MDIDKMISDYTDSLMAQAKRWQSMGYSADVQDEVSSNLGAVTLKNKEKTTEEFIEQDTPAPEQLEEPEKEDCNCEFHVEVFAGVYPVTGAKVHVKNNGELIYLLTTADDGSTERVNLTCFGPCDYRTDVFAEGFEGQQDIPVTPNPRETLRVQLMPLSDETD